MQQTVPLLFQPVLNNFCLNHRASITANRLLSFSYHGMISTVDKLVVSNSCLNVCGLVPGWLRELGKLCMLARE